MSKQSFKEGPVAKTLEKETAKIPSDVYLWAALGTMAFSLGLFMTKTQVEAMGGRLEVSVIFPDGGIVKVNQFEGLDEGKTSGASETKTR